MANQCEWYPCHKDHCEGFSCKFCYCPLYEKDCEDLGGSPEYIEINSGRLKDCSKCLLPHKPDFNYASVV